MDHLPFESDIRIDAEGMWFYRGEEMTRREMISLFYQHLRQDSAGRYIIEMGRQKYPVDVQDTAYVVWSLKWADGESGTDAYVRLLLSDGSAENLNPETLRTGANHILYCRVKNQCFDARFSRAAYYLITERLQHDPTDDSCFLFLNGRRHYL
jgi:hypothetical protein